jgi:hypothetical protein
MLRVATHASTLTALCGLCSHLPRYWITISGTDARLPLLCGIPDVYCMPTHLEVIQELFSRIHTLSELESFLGRCGPHGHLTAPAGDTRLDLARPRTKAWEDDGGFEAESRQMHVLEISRNRFRTSQRAKNLDAVSF